LPQLKEIQLRHVFLFMVSWSNYKYGTLAAAIDSDWWGAVLLIQLHSVLAIGLELWVFDVYVPNMSGFEALPLLRVHKRRRRVDPAIFEQACHRARALGGSRRLVYSALTDSAGRDHDVTHSMVLLHHDKRVQAFAGATMVNCTWDPSTYSGKAYNIGFMYNIDGNITTDFSPKVPAWKHNTFVYPLIKKVSFT
jgi:hypothetical protein